MGFCGFLSNIFPISEPLPRLAVPEGKTRICVSGFGISEHTGRARALAAAIAEAYPDEYETWFYFDTRGFRPDFIGSIKKEIEESEVSSMNGKEAHRSSPFCWLEMSKDDKKELTAIGGRDDLCDWTIAKFDKEVEKNKGFLALTEGIPPKKECFFDNKTPGTAKTE